MKPTIAGTIFFLIWLAIMLFWGNSQNIKPDLSSLGKPQSEQIFGHPLWNK